MLRYNHVTTDVFTDTFLAESTNKRNHQFTCARVIVTDFVYTHIFTTKSKGYGQHAIRYFFTIVVVSPDIITNFSGEEGQRESQIVCKKFG